MANKTNPIWLLTKEQLEDLVATKDSITDILNAAGATVKGGGSWRAFQARVASDNIDLTDFLARRKEAKRSSVSQLSQAIPLTELLVENSNYSRLNLKKRLIDEGLLEYACSLCGNNGSWLNNPLSLQLDHINGVSNDNRLENLRLLCPNCHSQTLTFAGKRIRKTSLICSQCGSPRGRHSKTGLCKQCSSANNAKSSAYSRRTVERPTKEVLLDLLSKHSYTAVGKMYGVSDNAVRKWLK